MLEEWLRAAPRIATALEEIADELAQQRADRRREAETLVTPPGEWPEREQ
jgi:GrpB-like predicted nucleotidyltransferase (UPF0157 family)